MLQFTATSGSWKVVQPCWWYSRLKIQFYIIIVIIIAEFIKSLRAARLKGFTSIISFNTHCNPLRKRKLGQLPYHCHPVGKWQSWFSKSGPSLIITPYCLLLLTGTEADRRVKEAAWHGAKKPSQSFVRASFLTIMNLNSSVRWNATLYYPQKISEETLKERANERLREQEHRGRPTGCIMDFMNLTRSPASLYPTSLPAYSFIAVVWLFRD